MILVQWTLHTNQNHLLQCHIGVQPYLLYFSYWGSSSEFSRWQRSHQWRKMNFSALIPCFFDQFFLIYDFRQVPRRYFLQFFPFFLSLPPLHLLFLDAWDIGMNLWTRLQWVVEFIPFEVIRSWWGLCPAPSSLGLVLSSASTTQAYFVLRFPTLRWVSPGALYRYFGRHCCWHWNFQLSTKGFPL